MNGNTQAKELLDQFLASWAAGCVEPRAGVGDAELTKFEERHGVLLPIDFRTYLRRANGMQDGDMDSEHLVRFYRIDEIARVATESSGDQAYTTYFAFADFMIGSHEYGIALAGPHYGVIAIVDDAGPVQQVASSFLDFMAKYLHSPEALLRRGDTR